MSFVIESPASLISASVMPLFLLLKVGIMALSVPVLR